MGGTDKNDQLTKLQRCRRQYKWPRRLVVKFFMWCTYNAYVLQNVYAPHQQPGKRVVTFHAFIDQLCHGLVDTYRQTTAHRPAQRFETDLARLVNQGDAPQHMPERPADASTNNRCVVCNEKYKRAKVKNPGATDKDLPKRTKTVIRCCKCKTFLCISAGEDNCFAAYHSKIKFWHE
jgi:hypothetical protein